MVAVLPAVTVSSTGQQATVQQTPGRTGGRHPQCKSLWRLWFGKPCGPREGIAKLDQCVCDPYACGFGVLKYELLYHIQIFHRPVQCPQ